ncbi:MAG: DUF5711 family protein, partial [Lachnospiraceae bacterium]
MRQNGIVELHIAEPLEELEAKIKKQKHQRWKRIIILIVSTLMVIGGTYLLLNVQTYNRVRVVKKYESESAENTKFIQFSNHIFKYGRDGASLLNKNGKEIWNQSYQVKNPIVEISDKTAIIGDSGGTQILVFDKNGMKGEIKTTVPIEKISVSDQGIVAALLKDETSPKVMCYDFAGNVLVEHEASINKMGCPLDISISKNGYMLLVTYLHMNGDSYSTNVAYYNFDRVGQSKTDKQVSYAEYSNTIMPMAFFMTESTSVIIGDQSILFYRGKQIPKMEKEITLDKRIKSVVHTNQYISLLLKNDNKKGYELRVYNSNGTRIMSKDFVGEYSNIRMTDGEVLMYEGTKCNIYSVN